MSDDAKTPHISSRKDDHIDLTLHAQVEYEHKTTLLEAVELMHDSLPELAVADVDLTTSFEGKALEAPIQITGMTGGAARAGSINRELARVAQELGVVFGVGSQRAMLKHPELAETYVVRDVAPDIVLLGNIGIVQAADMGTREAEDLVGAIDADALCVHLNPGQELIQPEGDRDFTGCVDALTRLASELSVPVIAKETGCGLSAHTLDKIKRAGVSWVDVSGAGGTTWIGVETLRVPAHQRTLGQQLWEWGTPTAASIVYAKRRGLRTIATGGLRNGLDVARALALDADIAGMALPWLKAAHSGGADAALAYGQDLVHTLRTIMTLTGAGDLAQLRAVPKLIKPELKVWIDVP
ncbi:MAG: type 2 isopentenyl-diphosphate Delta-isomerase [Myxococcota bacterium]